MQSEKFINGRPHSHVSAPEKAVRIVIAYNDLDGGLRAMNVLRKVAERSGQAVDFQPLPWSFSMLGDKNWREVAAGDAVNADIMIIATSESGGLPNDVGQWAETAIRRKQGTTAAVVAMMGPPTAPECAGSPSLEGLESAAREAGLEFIAPLPRNGVEETIHGIHRRADAITPVLDEILHHHGRASGAHRN